MMTHTVNTLSPEVRDMLVDSVQKFVDSEYDFESRRSLAASKLGYSEKHWQLFAELGWLAIPFSEDLGGLDGDFSDMADVAECFGRGLVLEPFFSTLVQSANVLKQSHNEALKTKLIPKIIAGELILALAWEEAGSGSNPLSVSSVASRVEDSYLLSGEKVVVLAGPQAQGFIVSAKLEGEDQLGLFYLPEDTLGVTLENYRLVDGSQAATLSFDQVRIGAANVVSLNAKTTLESSFRSAIFLLCAEALGAMEKLLRTTADYTKTRKQFGAPIASFQVLRHLIADMSVILKKTRCLLDHCTGQLRETGDIDEMDVAALKVQTGRAAQFIGRQAIQIHGGIGMTDELDVGHYVKRLTVIDGLLGNGRFHLQKITSAL
ncbi:MAG: hypothetical protein CL693_03410 [Cellvibrionaceae bacterium]|nr:hypothetical protein [Cellvibrionaceae bacterium]|tara:strand:- start:13494 stop:14621 length:1128 start_codon:yes stop_codon:yes gene_type:complete